MRQWTIWFGTPRAIAQRLAFATVAGLFLGLIGPFGSYDAPASTRVISWTMSFWAGAALLSVALRGGHMLGQRIGLPDWFTLPAAAVVAAVPLAGVAWSIFHGLRPGISLSSPAEFYLQTVAITVPAGLGYLAVAGLVERSAGPPALAPRMATTAHANRFLDRLPPRLGRDLLALQMEDHYVRAHTPAGSDLVLIPLRQAIEELGGLDGLRTHRSWWVTRSAVERVREDGRNLRLILKGGLEAPVARANVAALRAAGWLG